MKKIINKTRSRMYRTARILGDVNAIISGRPDKIVKRYMRKKSGRGFGKIIRSIFR